MDLGIYITLFKYKPKEAFGDGVMLDLGRLAIQLGFLSVESSLPDSLSTVFCLKEPYEGPLSKLRALSFSQGSISSSGTFVKVLSMSPRSSIISRGISLKLVTVYRTHMVNMMVMRVNTAWTCPPRRTPTKRKEKNCSSLQTTTIWKLSNGLPSVERKLWFEKRYLYKLIDL